LGHVVLDSLVGVDMGHVDNVGMGNLVDVDTVHVDNVDNPGILDNPDILGSQDILDNLGKMVDTMVLGMLKRCSLPYKLHCNNAHKIGSQKVSGGNPKKHHHRPQLLSTTSE
jgi:hypothetical protein